jgi:hypothetical protein
MGSPSYIIEKKFGEGQKGDDITPFDGMRNVTSPVNMSLRKLEKGGLQCQAFSLYYILSGFLVLILLCTLYNLYLCFRLSASRLCEFFEKEMQDCLDRGEWSAPFLKKYLLQVCL